MPSIINSDDGVVSGTSGLKTTGGNDGLLNIQTNGSNAISISSGQRSTFPTTIGVGGATPSTSGSGITFPATQSASTNANTLDDYEEGDWTPVIQGAGGNPTVTYDSQVGKYTKIGNIVYVTGYIQTSARTGGSGDMRIAGLPFAVPSASFQGGSMIYYAINNGSVSQTFPNTDSGVTYFYGLYSNNNGANWSNTQISGIPNSLAAIKFAYFYMV